MAIQPQNFTNSEMQVMMSTVLRNNHIDPELRRRCNKVLEVAYNCPLDGFFIGSYAEPKFRDVPPIPVDPDEVD